MTKIAICTVNWNNAKDTLELLESLKKIDTSGLVTRIFIVSNQKIPGYEVILKRKNRGSAGGYNDAAKAALKWGADFILLMGNDTLIKDLSLLKALIETTKSNPKIGVVAPKMLFAPGFEFYKEKYAKKDVGQVLWYAGGSFDWRNVMSQHRGIDEVDKGQYDQAEETGFCNTTCIFVPATVFKNGIFFDEDLFAYFDDNDWLQRLTLAGFKKYYDGRVAIYHKVSRTAGIGSPTSDYYITRNRLIFGLRYASLHTKIALLREALRLLFFGRPMQKRGVLDFFIGRRGALDRPTAS